MGKTNLPRLVTYAENPQLVSRLEEFCKQNRCSTSKGINQLLEQALGLIPSASTVNSTVVVPSASTAPSVDDTPQKSLKTELNKIDELERKVDDLRSAVNELRVSPPAMPLASTVHTTTGTTSTLASTALSLEAIQSHLIKEFNNNENNELNQELEQIKAKTEKNDFFYQLWYHVFPNKLAHQDICKYPNSDNAWVKTNLNMDEAFKVFIPS